MSVRTADRQIIQTGEATFLQTQLSAAEHVTVTGSPEGWEVCGWGGGWRVSVSQRRLQTGVCESLSSLQTKLHT